MATKKTKTGIKLGDGGFKAETYAFNDGEQKYLSINIADLKIILRDFKKAVRESDIVNPTIAVIGIWLPVFTSDFKPLFKLTADQVVGAYVIIAVLLTLYLLRNIFLLVISRLGLFQSRVDLKTSDPDKLADQMCRRKDEN